MIWSVLERRWASNGFKHIQSKVMGIGLYERRQQRQRKRDSEMKVVSTVFVLTTSMSMSMYSGKLLYGAEYDPDPDTYVSSTLTAIYYEGIIRRAIRDALLYPPSRGYSEEETRRRILHYQKDWDAPENECVGTTFEDWWGGPDGSTVKSRWCSTLHGTIELLKLDYIRIYGPLPEVLQNQDTDPDPDLILAITPPVDTTLEENGDTD